MPQIAFFFISKYYLGLIQCLEHGPTTVTQNLDLFRDAARSGHFRLNFGRLAWESNHTSHYL